MACTEKLNRLKSDVEYVLGKLTRPITTRLGHIAKGSSPQLFGRFCEIQYETKKVKDKNGKEVEEKVQVPHYYESLIGVVAGAKIVDQPIIRAKLLTTLALAKRAISEAVAEPSMGSERLGQWIDQINGLDDAEEAIQRMGKAYGTYTQPDNLKTQIFMTEQPASERAMAQLAIEFAGSTWKVTDPDELIRQYRVEIERANKDRTFTVTH